MGLFQNFPYTNFHEINLDQILKIVQNMQTEWESTKNEWNSLQEFVNNYFDNLDVSEEVLSALQKMADSGELNSIIDPVIVNQTSAWLASHITPTTPAVDNTLSVAGAAADAKTTGDAVIDLKNNITETNTEIGYVPSEKVTGTAQVTATRYTTIKSPFKLQRGVEYKAKWTISEPLAQTIYCYIIDNNDPENLNIFTGGTALAVGDTEFSVTFIPSVDYNNLRAVIYSNVTGYTANFEIDRSSYPKSKIEIMEEKIDTYIKPFEYGHNGLKTSMFEEYALWNQGVARIDNILVGFNSSADDHSNTSIYTSMYYENGYEYRARGTHNLGHCASADYSTDTDVLLVANGTYTAGVTPTIYLVENAKNITNEGGNILVSDSNVIPIELTGIDGDGVIACFGESSDIIYAMTSDNSATPFARTERYIYKLILGKGSNNMRTLYPTQSVGIFISGKGTNEYNGTAYILKKYIANYAIELQGMKFLNGRIVVSADCRINDILTSYLLFIKTYDGDNSFEIDESKWIPSLKANGEYVATETEDFALADGFGYISIFRTSLQTNETQTLKFSLID